MLISEASFAWLSSKFTRNQIITAATIIKVIGYMLFMSVGYIFTKEYCFTEYHRFPDLLFAGSIQYDDDCHVKIIP